MKTLKICALVASTFFSNCFKYNDVAPLNPTFEIMPPTRSYTDAIQTQDGGYVAVGRQGTRIVIEKFDRVGGPVWSNAELLPSGADNGLATALKETAAGDILLSARAENRGVVFKCNGENGDKIGTYNIDNQVYGYDFSTLEDIVILPNGNIAAIGTASTTSNPDTYFFLFVVLKESGNTFQEVVAPKDLPSFGNAFTDADSKMRMKPTPDGGFVVAATVAEGWTFSYGVVEKLKSNGDYDWHFSYINNPTIASIYDVEIYDGKYYVVGNDSQGAYLGCVDAISKQETSFPIAGTLQNDNARGIALLPDNQLAIIGSQSNGTNATLSYFKVNPSTRKMVSPKFFNGDGDNNGDAGKSVFITKEGGILLSGYTYSGSQRNGYLIKADMDGNL